MVTQKKVAIKEGEKCKGRGEWEHREWESQKPARGRKVKGGRQGRAVSWRAAVKEKKAGQVTAD